MTGRTKKFMEDMLIFIIIIVVITVVYFVISNFMFDEKNIIKKEDETPLIQENEIEKPMDTIEVEDLNITKNKEENIIKQENTPEEKEVVENKEKKVDLQKLKQFISLTEEKIAKNIVYNIDNNASSNEKYLKIRITLLKSGDYEQLKFVDGNEHLFEQNKANITKIFPLSIDQEIIEEFPRYLRIELRKNF